MADDPAYARFKQICLALPETKVTMTWGAPHIRVGEKIFTGWGLAEDEKSWSFSAKIDKDKQAAMVASDKRFTVAAYVGKHGWVSVEIRKGKENWGEIAALVEESYRNIAPKKLVAQLGAPPAKKKAAKKKAAKNAPARNAPAKNAPARNAPAKKKAAKKR